MSNQPYGLLATHLLQESRRSTQSSSFFKYNDALVRSIIREQRQLESSLVLHITKSPPTQPPPPAVILLQTAILRNKRCLLAYHAHRLDDLRDMYWAVGGALPHILNHPDTRSKLSPHEVDYLRSYHTSAMDFRAHFSSELDIMATMTSPPKELHVTVKVVKDCGVIQTELGPIDFSKGQRFVVRRADIEHLIFQGYLEVISGRDT
ncbi:DNA replication protein psf1 [Leucoagaricus gongylophorus]